MAGGQAQIDAETKLAAHSHGRLESLLRGARTDECREEITTAYQRYMGAQALVSDLVYNISIVPGKIVSFVVLEYDEISRMI